MVKIVGQFVQATSNAGSDKKLLARSGLAKKNQAEGQTTESESAPAESVTAEPPVEQARLTEPIRPFKVPRGKSNLRSVRGEDHSCEPLVPHSSSPTWHHGGQG